jgi:arylsulfatase
MLISFVFAILIGCDNSSKEAKSKSKASSGFVMDRTILPIQPPKSEPITEMDARNVTKPDIFEIKAPAGSPNIVIVLIDDIGFGATSTFGGAIETPTFDRLAQKGLRFNQFHTTALCSPTRASLLSGRKPSQYECRICDGSSNWF